jgi:ABC-2 type transport system permease protein
MRSLALVRHNLALLAAEPGPILSRIGMPLVLVTVLRPLYDAALGRGATVHAVTGMLVFFSLLGLSLVGNGVLVERTWHTLDRLRATPARPAEILVGKAIPYGLVLLAQQASLLGYGVVVLDLSVPRWDLLILATLGWATTLLTVGAALATLVSGHSAMGAVTDIGGLVLTVMGGAMVPLALLPSWAQAIAPASPGYWALGTLRAAIDGDASSTLRGTAVLLAVAVVFGALAGWRITRGWGRNHGL